LFVPAGRWQTLPVMRTTHSLRSAAARSKSSLGKSDGSKTVACGLAVADINEDESAEVAARVDPAAEGDHLPDVSRAQFVAMMCAFHVKIRSRVS